jgi:hypothetical protein
MDQWVVIAGRERVTSSVENMVAALDKDVQAFLKNAATAAKRRGGL